MNAVAHTADLQRILSLPRRVWSPEDLDELTTELTSILRTPTGTMRLRPSQALALHDAALYGGLFAPLGVGEGKTLLSLLLPVVFEATRPLLILPANLLEKTQRERGELSKHWRIPTNLRMLSYDALGRVSYDRELDDYKPDAIIADEVHRLKNRRAAVTRRVARYMHANPETKFAGFSGTVMRKSILDFAHALTWALKTNAPIPHGREEQEEWAQALDDEVDPMARMQPGALLRFCSPEELARHPPHVAARHGFRRRLTETPGVVATIGAGERVDAAITIKGHFYDVRPVTDANFRTLREEWMTPDGWPLCEAVDVWRHAQELAIGLVYVWNPRPAQEWLAARKAWAAFVRGVLAHSRSLDSELQVANACDSGRLDATALKAWRQVRASYTPNVEAIWYDDSALDACRKWMTRPGIVWTKHALFAAELARRTGVPYFGAGGRDAKGAYIEDSSSPCVIASVAANREGRNLQAKWSRNLIVCPPPGGDWWEQVIARTHRPGQTADEVTVDVLLGCRENWSACQQALTDAQAIQDTTGKTQKLTLARLNLPSAMTIEALRTPRWVR